MHDVIEYFSKPGLCEFHDPRKHAVALTYSAIYAGTPAPTGEVVRFDCFPPGASAKVLFGFGQGGVVERIPTARRARAPVESGPDGVPGVAG